MIRAIEQPLWIQDRIKRFVERNKRLITLEDAEEVVIRGEQEDCAEDEGAEEELESDARRGRGEDCDVWFHEVWILSEGPAE